MDLATAVRLSGQFRWAVLLLVVAALAVCVRHRRLSARMPLLMIGLGGLLALFATSELFRFALHRGAIRLDRIVLMNDLEIVLGNTARLVCWVFIVAGLFGVFGDIARREKRNDLRA
jgi:hypothetical protein